MYTQSIHEAHKIITQARLPNPHTIYKIQKGEQWKPKIPSTHLQKIYYSLSKWTKKYIMESPPTSNEIIHQYLESYSTFCDELWTLLQVLN